MPVTDDSRFFTPVPEWVILAGLSPQALALYTVLLSHVNRERGDGLAWPSMDTLARLLGFKHRHSIAQYVKELVELGAATASRRANSTNRGNVYQLQTKPPAGYEGLRSITEYYAARKAEDATQGPRATVMALGRDTTMDGATDTGMDQNQTNGTRRSDPYESTSGDQVAWSGSNASFSTEIKIFLPADFDRRPAEGLSQTLIGETVGAVRKIGWELDPEAKSRFGNAVKSNLENGVDRRKLVAMMEYSLNEGRKGRGDWAWMFGYDRAA